MNNVLIIFQSDTEHIEQLALAVAVGVIEAEGRIRLRRLAIDGSPEIGHKGYGKLQEADLSWADTVVIGLERPNDSSQELTEFLQMLRSLEASGFTGKKAWTFAPDGPSPSSSPSRSAVEAALQAIGFTLVAPATKSSGDLPARMKEAGWVSVRPQS
jgi:hypothetical protein